MSTRENYNVRAVLQRKVFEDAVIRHIEGGRDYHDLDVDDQVQLCYMYAITMPTSQASDYVDDLLMLLPDLLFAGAKGESARVGGLHDAAVLTHFERDVGNEWYRIASDFSPIGSPELTEDAIDRAQDMRAAR